MPKSEIAATIQSPYGAKRLKAVGKYSSFSLSLFLGLMSRLSTGRLEVTLPDGSLFVFVGRDQTGPHADLTIHHPRAIRRLLTGGRLGFCEAYLNQDWSSSDAARLFELALQNERILSATIRDPLWLRTLRRWLTPDRRSRRRGGALGAASVHKELGNTFYAQWLDPGMTYSSALFTAPTLSLQDAQKAKYAQICERLILQPQHRVLELGCGWGGFSEYAARELGVRVTALTHSPAQHAYASNRIQMAGLADRVDVQMIDYRDVAGQYDRIVSIEALETIGAAYWPAFFRTIHDRLVPGGRAELQVITVPDALYEDYHSEDFIRRYICPDIHIPSEKKLREAVEKAGLIDLGHVAFGKDYARTKRLWREQFQEQWPKIQMLGFDGHFRRVWELYLQYCEAGFAAGTIDVIQKSIVKPHDH